MSSLEEHEAEQARITEECMEGTCDHPECREAMHIKVQRDREALRDNVYGVDTQ